MSPAPEPGRKGEVRRHGASMESRPGKGLGTLREAGKGGRAVGEKVSIFLPGVRMPVGNPAGPPARAPVGALWSGGQGAPVREPAAGNPDAVRAEV